MFYKWFDFMLLKVQNPKVALPFLLLGGLLMQVLAYWKFGIFYGYDTAFYIRSADTLLEGDFPQDRGKWYMGYIGLLALLKYLDCEVYHVVYIQSALSLAAIYAIYRLTYRLSQSYLPAFLSAFFYIGWIELHQWNMVIYTDAVFTSLSIIGFASFYCAKGSFSKLLSVLLLLLAVAFRPTGIGIVLALIAYGAVWWLQRHPSWQSPKRWLPWGIALAAVVLVGINYLFRDYIPWFLDSYATAEIVYPKHSLGVEPAVNAYMPEASWPPVLQLVMYILGNPLYFAKLFFIKLFFFLGHVKPYYSAAHNIGIAITLYPIYFFAALGVREIGDLRAKSFIVSFLLVQTLIVASTSVNWDGRFLLPLLPYVFILAGLGLWRIKKLKLRRDTVFRVFDR